MTTDQWTIAGILSWTQGHFEKWRPETPRLDAELLLAFVLGCSRLDLYLKADQPLNQKERKAYRELVQQRADGCPIAYLIGEKEFWSLTLEVNKNTLIPRPDTETLVENTVVQIQNWQIKHPESQCQIAELGTGTAAIPLAICAEVKNLHIIAVDCSKDVLEVAERNMERHKSLLSPRNNLIELVESNLFSKINPTEKLDFIISNPPYIPSKNISSLQVDITQYEPLIALDGGPDGLSFYRYLLETAPSLLTPEGEMFLEIGFDQQANLNLLLKEFPDWKTSVFQPDLQGNDRVWELGLS
ncbi:MAG: peptide chain release factor N(5)-glutamine methyltransferase [SAR324 cluster bacterium]|nr:peptide chain release factor N(5)-glutamine methyltransferase [SAR324 cluster bacterium]MEC9070372.1 peptide chain release factor N(5)-glutamine methyltransferase [SAR324 cluster bacterium]MED5240358.1 peptide chain release factor N(5)-glutamine methyltransferase [SAR324 cluster bacterium]